MVLQRRNADYLSFDKRNLKVAQSMTGDELVESGNFNDAPASSAFYILAAAPC